MSTDILELQQPLKEGAIRSVNFFNGRLLASKDLIREQQARREADWRNGLAIGDGVAFGLEVARDTMLDQSDKPVVRVKAGLAVNRKGQTLRLTSDTSVALARRFDSTTTSCVFANCNPIGNGTYVAGAGVYVLTIAPAEVSEGYAPTNGLDPSNVRCNRDATLEAVQFRLLSVNPLHYSDLDIASDRFRNLLAYRCFGVEEREAWYADPLESAPTYGLVDQLRSEGLNDYDVPLALLYWTTDGIQFVDVWAVRRALLAPDALTGLTFSARRRRLIEAQAMCAQFQQQLTDLIDGTADLSALVATNHYRYLPPFGFVPLQGATWRGAIEESFFSGLVRRPGPGSDADTEFIDARQLGALYEQALAQAPMDVTQEEFMWVFRPWQNVQASLADSTQPVVVFASGHLPDLSVARFDLARFDFSNYESRCGG